MLLICNADTVYIYAINLQRWYSIHICHSTSARFVTGLSHAIVRLRSGRRIYCHRPVRCHALFYLYFIFILFYFLLISWHSRNFILFSAILISQHSHYFVLFSAILVSWHSHLTLLLTSVEESKIVKYFEYFVFQLIIIWRGHKIWPPDL